MLEFQLRNDAPAAQPAKFESTGGGKQRVMFCGLDCLPGQKDLFATDGVDNSPDIGTNNQSTEGGNR